MYSLRSGNYYKSASSATKPSADQTTIQFRKRRRAVNNPAVSLKQLRDTLTTQTKGMSEDRVLFEKYSPPKRAKLSGTPHAGISRQTRSQSSLKQGHDTTHSTTPLLKYQSPLKETNTPPATPSQGLCDPLPNTTPSFSTPIRGTRHPTPRVGTARRLVFPNSLSGLFEVKKSLHNSVPSSLLCRDHQLSYLSEFVQTHIEKKRPGSLYISGAPGTGKTACLCSVLNSLSDTLDSAHIVTVNCMGIKHSQAIYSRIACELLGSKVTDSLHGGALQSALVRHITSCKEMIVVVLDEVDQLDSRGQEVLYTIFEWPALPKSKLLLIGIANALDLTDRVLPRLQSHSKCRPQLLHFPPYTKDQIASILEDRLGVVDVEGCVIDHMAIQFCARKVAAVHGDVRKALDIFRRAIEMAENVGSCLRVKQLDKENTGTRRTVRVTLRHVADVITEVYSSTIGGQKGQLTFPLQQKLAACTLLCMVKGCTKKESTLGKLYEAYVKVCCYRRLRYEGETEFAGVCEMLETRGIITTKKAKEARFMKLTLKLEESELEYALQDKLLITSVLEHGVPT